MWKKGAAAVLALILVLLLGGWLLLQNIQDPYILDQIDLGNGRLLRVYAEYWGDSPNRGLYSQILHNGAVVQPIYYFGSAAWSDEDLRFEVVTAADGDLIGLVEASDPDVILLFFHFPTRSSGPTAATSLSVEDQQRFLAMFREAHPEQGFVLLSHVPGSRDLRVW